MQASWNLPHRGLLKGRLKTIKNTLFLAERFRHVGAFFMQQRAIDNSSCVIRRISNYGVAINDRKLPSRGSKSERVQRQFLIARPLECDTCPKVVSSCVNQHTVTKVWVCTRCAGEWSDRRHLSNDRRTALLDPSMLVAECWKARNASVGETIVPRGIILRFATPLSVCVCLFHVRMPVKQW